MRIWNIAAPMFFWIGAIGLIVPSIHATDYFESTDGDLSNSRTDPTPFLLSAGTNMLTATSGVEGDQEFLRADVPVGASLASLVLQSYTSTSAAAFVGMRIGENVPEDATARDLSGYTLFGAQLGNVGNDILPQMGTAFGAMGFTPPLPAGSYYFWLHQPSSVATTYQFNFNVESLAPPGVVGDYNNDDVVDAADYVVWLKNVGASTLMHRDPENSGPVGEADYLSWRENFGLSTSGAGAVTSIPEPGTGIPIALAGLAWICRRRM